MSRTRTGIGSTAGTPAPAPAPVRLHNAGGASEVLLVCEHASNHIPREYGDLGLDAEARLSHVAWDPGAAAVARRLSAALDAPLVECQVSRLVYDCNRPPDAPDAMPARSEVFDIPGNAGLTAEQRQQRIRQVYLPFRDMLAGRLRASPAPRALITLHSFTPIYMGRPRAVELGVLHDTDSRLADAILAAAGRHTDMLTRRNDPYGPEDGVTHTLKEHALDRGILNVMLEIRNDLIATPAQQDKAARSLDGMLRDALAGFGVEIAREAAR